MSEQRWTVEYRPSEPSGIPITVTQPTDPAYALLLNGHTSTPEVFRIGCYICEDPEFAQMGLPLCQQCPFCKARTSRQVFKEYGHVAADDSECDDCGRDVRDYYVGQSRDFVPHPNVTLPIP